MMEIKILKKTLSDALSDVLPLSGKNKVLPILNDVLLFTKENRIRLQTSDTQTTMRRYVTAESISEDGEFCVDCVTLSRVISSLPNEVITLSLEDGTLNIIHSKGKAQLPVDAAEDFPSVDEGESEATEIAIPAATLREIISTGRPYIKADEFRPQLAQLYMEIAGGELTFCATDSNALITGSYPIEGQPEVSFMIDIPTLSILSRLNFGAQDVKIKVSEKVLSFKATGMMIYTRRTEGKYPKFRSIIPQDNTIKCTVSREALIALAQRVSILSPVSGLLKFDIQPLSMVVTTDDIDLARKSAETLECVSTSGIQIGLKSEYVITSLKSFPDDEVTISLKAPNTSILIEGQESSRLTALVMPMILNV